MKGSRFHCYSWSLNFFLSVVVINNYIKKHSQLHLRMFILYIYIYIYIYICVHTHTHTHTHTYIYIYIYIYMGILLALCLAKMGHCHIIHNVCIVALFRTRLYSLFTILTQRSNFLANQVIYLQKLEDL